MESEWLAPLRARWGDRPACLVPVVPVRETEAWLIADGNAIRAALGVNWSDADMGLPQSPKDVERVEDPKRVLDDVMRRVRRSVDDHYGQLGELVSLDQLDLVPAYRRWWHDTKEALAAIGFQPA